MVKLGRPKGLVRYDSLTGLKGGKTKFIRPRTIFYTVLALVGLAVLSYRATGIAPMFANALRMSGSAFYVSDGVIRNRFQVRVINKRNTAASYTFSLEGDVPSGSQGSGERNHPEPARAGRGVEAARLYAAAGKLREAAEKWSCGDRGRHGQRAPPPCLWNSPAPIPEP